MDTLVFKLLQCMQTQLWRLRCWTWWFYAQVSGIWTTALWWQKQPIFPLCQKPKLLYIKIGLGTLNIFLQYNYFFTWHWIVKQDGRYDGNTKTDFPHLEEREKEPKGRLELDLGMVLQSHNKWFTVIWSLFMAVDSCRIIHTQKLFKSLKIDTINKSNCFSFHHYF